MRILVLGGSPKGETSVTWQYVRWIKENLGGHEIECIQIASRIKLLEKDEAAFAQVIEAVRGADAILWAFPLYFCTVCSQYKRFIELIAERGAEGAFRGRYAASLSTSIHFFDHTAHEYIRGVSEDLGMPFAGSFSPAMGDLNKSECRRQLLVFAGELIGAAQNKLPLPRRTAALPQALPGQTAQAPRASVADAASQPDTTAPGAGKRVLVLVDYPDRAIGAMARRFAAAAEALGGREHQVELGGWYFLPR